MTIIYIIMLKKQEHLEKLEKDFRKISLKV